MKARHLIAVIALAALSAVADEVPKLLPFQAKLTDAQGASVTNGVRLVQFRLYSVPVAGTPVWAGEIHRTTVNGGLVNVLLGMRTPFTGVDFNQQIYLEMTVDVDGDNAITAADPPMLPRQIVLPSVFAKEAATARDSAKLGGADWSALLTTGNDPRADGAYVKTAKLQPGTFGTTLLVDAAVTTPKIADAAVTDAKLAAQSVALANLKQEIINQLVPPGTVVAFAGPAGNVPAGWLICDGTTYARAQFPALYNAIGIAWGAGGFNVENFQVPDLRGEFLRGVSQGTGRDPEANSRVRAYDGGNTGDQVGSYQYHQFASHGHGVTLNGGVGGLLAVNLLGASGPGWNDSGDNYSPTGYGSVAVLPSGGSETRPINASVYYIIKY
jgi:microcystin-dependent protein